MSLDRAESAVKGWRHTLAMLKVGVIGFGGGSALIPVMEKELVKPGALSTGEFVQDTIIANITPGALPVKVAALSGARVGGARLALIGALSVALPGTAATVGLMALFSQLGAGAIQAIEFASLGVTAFIIYLLAHYVSKVVAPDGRARGVPIIIATLAFLASGAGKTVGLGQDITGMRFAFNVPELSALGLVLVALVGISVYSLWQYLRRHTPDEVSIDTPRAGQSRRAVNALLLFSCLTALAGLVALVVPPVGETTRFLAFILASTVTSFGGGEAYVGVADGFFVASGIVEPAVFYGQIVPVANAMPGPILIKIASAVAFVAGGPAGWILAAAVFLLTVASCSALAVGVLAGYDRARNSLLVRNTSTYILPVICGLLASTAVSMLHSNVRIAADADVPGVVTIIVSIGLAALVPLIHRAGHVPDILIILLFAAISWTLLSVV